MAPERPANWNINPVHETMWVLGTNSTHTPVNLITDPASSLTAYSSFTTFVSTSSHTYFEYSGYQYLTQQFYTISVPVTEVILAEEERELYYTKYQEEVINHQDLTFTGTSYQNEEITIGDELLSTIIPSWDETITSSDQIDKTIFPTEHAPVGEEWIFTWTKYQNEYFSASDLVQQGFVDQYTYSMQTGIVASATKNYSLTIQSDVYDTNVETLRFGIIPWNLSPVTSISAMPSGSSNTPVLNVSSYGVPTFVNPITALVNPWEPTVILGGTTFVSNPCTSPPPSYIITPNTYFVKWLNVEIGGGVKTCHLLNFDLSLDRTGGQWSFSVTGDPGYSLGDTINLFGLNGTVTGKGLIYTNSQAGTHWKGIFGVRNMNKQLNILAANTANSVLFAYLTNSLLSTQQVNTLGNFEGAARAIAHMAGANLNWYLPGGSIPLVDFTINEGDTALGALSSMAAQFGGVLTWNGGNSYTIGPPNSYAGIWEVPNKYMLTPAGAQFYRNLDLTTGTFGPGFYSVPIVTFFDPRVFGLPDNIPSDIAVPKVQKIGTIGKLLTSRDPAYTQEVPIDTTELFFNVFVQNYTGTSINPLNGLTGDESQWVSLGTPSPLNTNTYLRYQTVGGAFGATKLYAVIPYTLFPSIDPRVANGNFFFNIGITRDNKQALFEAAVDSRNNQVRNALAKLLGSFRYVKSYDGNINSFFFGSIPLPGMYGRATPCGTDTVEGVIESVSFTYPGLVSVQVSQWSYIDFIKNFYNLDFTNPSGIS